MTDRESPLYAELRPAAFAIAYRMLGSVSEAEDVVQDALLRLHRVLESGEEIESPRAYVATVVSRLSIDVLRSARVRRETYVGEWLPEPLVTDEAADPAQRAELADSLSVAFLVLLESLSPEQRAAFLLHDVFDYAYGEIAPIVGTSEANVRQLASRARRHVSEGRPRYDASREQQEELGRRFLAAVGDGDVQALEIAAGRGRGPPRGRRRQGARPGQGPVRPQPGGTHPRRVGKAGSADGRDQHRAAEINGQAGAIVRDGEGRIVAVWALEIAEGRVQAIHSVVNPDKLAHLGEPADAYALLRGRGKR